MSYQPKGYRDDTPPKDGLCFLAWSIVTGPFVVFYANSGKWIINPTNTEAPKFTFWRYLTTRQEEENPYVT